MNLITAFEVVEFAPVDSDYPTADVCDHITRVEYDAFTACYLGLDFYDILVADLVDVSALADYDSNTTYALGDRIIIDGWPKESTANANNTHPDDSNTLWIPVRKFETSCYEDLWVKMLRYWLAMEVIYTSIRYTTFKAGAHGIAKFYDESTKSLSVSPAVVSEYKKDLRNDIDRYLKLIMNWIEKYNGLEEGECDFSAVGAIAEADCGDEICRGPKRRSRMHFKN